MLKVYTHIFLKKNMQKVILLYTKKLIEHFQNPRNVGQIKDANGIGTIGDPSCGDYLCIYIKVDGELLSDIKFEAFGCPALIGTTSILTEMAIGKNIRQALEITELEVVQALGGLPDQKVHCSNLGTAALHQAIINYFQGRKTGKKLKSKLDKSS